MALAPHNPPPRPGDRRYSRDDWRRAVDWLMGRALGQGDEPPPIDLQPETPRLLARITGILSASGPPALYSWEFASEDRAGETLRDLAGFKGDFEYLPAYEQSGSLRVPIDGSALVELYPGLGGNYYRFDWPERYTPFRITGSSGRAYGAVEQAPQEGGGWADMPGGRRCVVLVLTGDTTSGSAAVTAVGSTADLYIGQPVSGAGVPAGATVAAVTGGTAFTLSVPATATATGVSLTFLNNPMYEANGATAVPADTIVFAERGHAACPDVVAATLNAGGGSNPVHSVCLTNARGGTWFLTVGTPDGGQAVTGPLAFNGNAAALLAALRALPALPAATVTGTGTQPDPFVITWAGTTDAMGPVVGDPFGLEGVQEWSFQGPGAGGVAVARAWGPGYVQPTVRFFPEYGIDLDVVNDPGSRSVLVKIANACCAPPSGCVPCPDATFDLWVEFPGVTGFLAEPEFLKTTDPCFEFPWADCAHTFGAPVCLTRTGPPPLCNWGAAAGYCFDALTGVNPGANYRITFGGATGWALTVELFAGPDQNFPNGTVTYGPAGEWDCAGALTLTRAFDSASPGNANGGCGGWPDTVTVHPGPCPPADSGSGGGPDAGGEQTCCDGECGDPGVSASVACTYTARAGAWAAFPGSTSIDCHSFGGGTHSWYATSGAAGVAFGRNQNGRITCNDGLPPGPPCFQYVDGSGLTQYVRADPGWTCGPFSAVFHVDDGAGNSMVVTAVG